MKTADEEPDTQKAFQMLKGAYVECHKLGFAMGFLPKRYGGGGDQQRRSADRRRGDHRVDPGFATILLVNGLALMPDRLVRLGGAEAQMAGRGDQRSARRIHRRLDGQRGGGSARRYRQFRPSGRHSGRHRLGRAATTRGAANTCSTAPNTGPAMPAAGTSRARTSTSASCAPSPSRVARAGSARIIVPRGTPGVTYDSPISKLGHRLCQNNAIVFENCRVPEENAFALGDGDLVISKAFTWSGPVAAIAAVGVARSAYEYVLRWAKTYTAGGALPIIHHQAVGYLLAEVAMKIEACRAFSWKAAHYLDQHDCEGHAVGAMAKVFCGETLFNAVFRAMQVMGVNALDRKHPVEKFLREAAVFPLYDAGNIGMQMRKIWGVMLDPEFDPSAIADSRPIAFKKSMEGVGTLGEGAVSGLSHPTQEERKQSA